MKNKIPANMTKKFHTMEVIHSVQKGVHIYWASHPLKQKFLFVEKLIDL